MSIPALYDLIKETSTTTGTGAWTLAGAVSGFFPFSNIGNGAQCDYAATDGLGNSEVGIGTYNSSGNTFSRNTVLTSTNSGALVSFVNPITIHLDVAAIRFRAMQFTQAMGILNGIW